MGQAQTEAGPGSDRACVATVYAISTQRGLLPLDWLSSPQTMSDKSQLPGYSIDDDNVDAHHIDVVTAEPERPRPRCCLPVLVTRTQSHRSTAAVSSPTRQGSTQSRLTPPNRQEAVKEHPTAPITTVTVAATPTTPPLPVDEFQIALCRS
jgi:hypothetical protein